jgi:hypothetical protein
MPPPGADSFAKGLGPERPLSLKTRTSAPVDPGRWHGGIITDVAVPPHPM